MEKNKPVLPFLNATISNIIVIFNKVNKFHMQTIHKNTDELFNQPQSMDSFVPRLTHSSTSAKLISKNSAN